MSSIDSVPVSLLTHRVEVEASSTFSFSEQADYGLLVPTLPGAIKHTIEFMSEGLDRKDALLAIFKKEQYFNAHLNEDNKQFFPIGPNGVSGILLVPEIFEWTLWRYDGALFKWKVVGIEAEARMV